MRRNVFGQVARGFLMGSADIVPGVSGGTIALVVGIYDGLIDNIRIGAGALGTFAKGDVKGGIERLKNVDWAFLIPLALGIVAALAILSSILPSLLEDHPVPMAGLFFGLIVGSIIVAWGILKSPSALHLAIVVGVGVVMFLLLGLRGGLTEDEVGQSTSPAIWLFLAAGALAICAMILPGISGSLILVLLGMYEPVLDAVHDRDVLRVVVFMVGAVVGLAIFSSVLHWLLEHYHDLVMAVLVGLMVGSLRILYPWPQGIDGTDLAAPSGSVVAPIALGLVAGIAVVALSRVANEREAHPESELSSI